ncbi:MAG: tRNA (adenosine(37)-N6)-threonylcarbamoyltransferase complex ATPase subunit type 1 TsaE [Helicobacter sp.]|nr:tRNA (adenosine(37)-N6)-threonylcarbamoyltransferase complex ATPase subunit type 1 TsaE [Helicobacter sp.]
MKNTQIFKLKLDELDPIIAHINALIDRNIRIFLLCGDLGSGKTTLVSRFGSSHGICNITSPTFSLMQSYEMSTNCELFHYDLYMHSPKKLVEMGFLEMLDSNVHFIEWGEPLRDLLINSGYNYALVDISRDYWGAIYKVSVG